MIIYILIKRGSRIPHSNWQLDSRRLFLIKFVKFSEKKVKQLNVMTHCRERFSWIACWIMTLFGFECYLFFFSRQVGSVT
jgi:hypothetical protein